MKINYVILTILILLSNSLFAQSEADSLIYEFIEKEDTSTLQKLINERGANSFISKDYSYLNYAIEGCKLSVVELFTKNKIPLGINEGQIEYNIESYIERLSCDLFLELNDKTGKIYSTECLIPAFVLLIENDYIPLKPTLLGKLNCYSDVLPEWYVVIQPVIKALMKKGLKIEDSIINITGEKNNYLLEICKWEKEYTKEKYKEHQKAIRNYILFLKEQRIDFNKKINGQKPIDLLSESFQKDLK